MKKLEINIFSINIIYDDYSIDNDGLNVSQEQKLNLNCGYAHTFRFILLFQLQVLGVFS